MSLSYYFRYFYFIGTNWNFKLALFTLYHEIKGEKKYQINTIKIDRLHSAGIKSRNLQHASIYQGVGYYTLEKAFDYLKTINANKDIVDFGSGKGRVMAVAAYYGFENITGIDFARGLCDEAKSNIAGIKSRFPSTTFTVICDDVVNYKIGHDTNVFFFFNPFDEVVMLQVVKNILLSIKQKKRKVHIVYVNPLHAEVFLSAGFEEEFYLRKMQYIELSILSNEIED